MGSRSSLSARLALSLTQIALAAALGACGTNPDDPTVISAQPVEQSVVTNGTARFVVLAAGTDLVFQWQRSTDSGGTWANVAGATRSVLEIANVTPDQDGHLYRAQVHGKSGSVTTSAAALHCSPVVGPPSFTVDLASPAQITEGGDITLAVTAAGSSLTYVWETSPAGGSTWSALSGNNSPTLLLQDLPLSDDGRRYKVTISNSAGSVTSQTATLSVKPVTSTPTVTTQPLAVSVKAPAAATFTVTVSGSPTPTVQWQWSATNSANTGDWADIIGANDLNYRIDTTTTSLSGRYYRAKVSNASDTVFSNSAKLTVTDADVAPTITTQPANQTITVGAQATFTVAASGTPTPTIQWQVSSNGGSTWTNITGANSANYSVTTSTVGSSQYRAVASNGVGSAATSDPATLTVNAVASVLSGKTWRSGSLVENAAGLVRTFITVPGFELGMSDDGQATAIFMHADGLGREPLQVSDRPAGSGATEPTWSTPTIIDSAAPVASLGHRPRLAVSPNGNAVIAWVAQQTCGADSYGAFVGQLGCKYIYSSRRLAGTATWEAPVKVVSSTLSYGGPIPMINDRGETAILLDGMPGMVNTMTSHRAGLALRTSSEASYRVEYLPALGLGTLREVGQHVHAGLDLAGNITVVGEQGNATGTDDIVAYRGTVAAGFGMTPVGEPLEDRSANASLIAMTVGLGGHVATVWKQTTATTSNAILISVRSPDTSTWQMRDLTPDIGTSLSDRYALRIADGAEGRVSFYDGCIAVRRIGGSWQPKQTLPTNCGLSSTTTHVAMDRNGNYIGWTGTGQWLSYDATLNSMVKGLPNGTPTGPDYVLGIAKSPRRGTTDQAVMALSPKGFGAVLVRTDYAKMPSALEPNGDIGGVDNLWGFYFR